jgi:hypothetical protein
MQAGTTTTRDKHMQSRHSGTLLQAAILFILSVALIPVMAVAAEPADGNNAMAGEVETTAAESGPTTRDKTSEVWEATKEGSAEAWDKTREISSDAWEATKEGSAKAWDKTREVSADAWEATKEGSTKAWDKTREVSSDAWEATKEGSAKAWDKTRELTQPEAEETVETPQADPQGPQP